jgi:nicotinamidase-related amidase
MTIILDAETTALLVIDVQIGLFSKATPVYQEQALLENINTLKELFTGYDAAVIYIQHTNQKLLVKDSQNWQFHPQLHVDQTDCIIHKTQGNAFEGTGLKAELDAHGISTLVVTGLVTNGCVRATTIGGHDLGYRVILVEDGHSTYIKTAAKLIREWNHTLGQEIAEVQPTAAISLTKAS